MDCQRRGDDAAGDTAPPARSHSLATSATMFEAAYVGVAADTAACSRDDMHPAVV